MPKKAQPKPAAPVGDSPAARLYLQRLILRQLLGVSEHTIDLGPGVNLIVGENASGKSSHLQAIRSNLGADRTSLIEYRHKNDDGTFGHPELASLLVPVDESIDYGVEVSRKGKGSAEVRERIGEDWRDVGRSVEWLRDVLDMEAAQPALWLEMSDAERQVSILEALPLEEYTREAALEYAGLVDFKGIGPLPEGLHPLDELDKIEEAVKASRAIEGAEKRRHEDAAKEILKGIPADAPPSVDEKLAEAEGTIERLAGSVGAITAGADESEASAVKAAEAAYAAVETNAMTAYRAKAAELREAHGKKVAELEAAHRKALEALELEVETAVDAASDEAQKAIEAAAPTRTSAIETARTEARQARAAVETKAAELAAARETVARLRGEKTKADSDAYFRKTAGEKRKAADVHARRWDELDAAIKRLIEYKLRLVEHSPIKGLALKIDEETGRKSLELDGVPLAQVNDGRLAELAVEVSLLRIAPSAVAERPHLPIILLDRLERLDSSKRSALLRAVASCGVQIIAACVTDGPLRVLRDEAAFADGQRPLELGEGGRG